MNLIERNLKILLALLMSVYVYSCMSPAEITALRAKKPFHIISFHKPVNCASFRHSFVVIDDSLVYDFPEIKDVLRVRLATGKHKFVQKMGSYIVKEWREEAVIEDKGYFLQCFSQIREKSLYDQIEKDGRK